MVVWKLDQLGRDLRHLVNTVHHLTARGVGFKVLSGHGSTIDTTSASGKLVFGIFAALAKFSELCTELGITRQNENHHRRYQITVGCDLLNDWTVIIRYGRTGQGGREIRFASPRPEEMRSMIRDRLRRRLSAPKRIGCPYRLTILTSAPSFDAAAWLPGEVMARFFAPD